MSNIEILVENNSKELFEIFRDTNIGVLDLRTADCDLQISDILPTFSKLKNLGFWGSLWAIVISSCLHQDCISLETGECSSEWLCSLLIKLSVLDHPVVCQLCNFVVQARGEDCCANSNNHESHMRSKLLACGMSNIEILVENGSKELF
ncbi:hypothetical protein DPMN_187894 [Dreissena polymorpha]|uniref:Uncharacterized protein n=1 Tax=Dreissena polymorpha TaxID=45954 RepID=A0A9D4DSX3_DREPO|nr:hypothetical protein DPMN_187894 [Dreissena polymorpha]